MATEVENLAKLFPMNPDTESDEGPLFRPESRRITRRSFLALSAASLGGLTLYSGEIARHWLSIEEHTIQLPRLPDSIRGLQIVQISDIHYLEFTESFF